MISPIQASAPSFKGYIKTGNKIFNTKYITTVGLNNGWDPYVMLLGENKMHYIDVDYQKFAKACNVVDNQPQSALYDFDNGKFMALA